MLQGEPLYDSARDGRRPFVRATAAEGEVGAEEAMCGLNAWIVRLRPRVQGSACSGPVLRRFFDELCQYGFSASAVRSMADRFPNLLCSGWAHAHGTGEEPGMLLRLERYGFSRLQLVRICERFPRLLSFGWGRTHGAEDEPGLLLHLERYGFTRPQVIRICVRFPAALSYAWGKTHGTEDKPGILLNLERHGFTRPQVIHIISLFPTVLGYSWQRTHGTEERPGVLLTLERHGLSHAGAIALCVALPVVLGCRGQRTEAQLRLARVFGLPPSRQLILFAPEKTRWRWSFLVGRKGYAPARARAALFLAHTEFVRRFRQDYP